jgi:hypothetical protein
MRQMIGKRKGGEAKPAIVIAIGKPKDESEPVDNATEEADEPNDGRPKDVVKCPECGCEINTITGKAIADDGTEPDGEYGKGKIAESLDETDSQYNKPGPFGSASDAARGEEAQAKSLGALRNK